MEVWKDIKGFEGKYQISTLGNVRGLERLVPVNGGIKLYPERLLNPSKEKDKYKYITLWHQSKSKSFFVHRLVAMAFIDNPNDYPSVNHIDGCKDNNCVENLEWCTHKQNSMHALKIGLRKTGEDHHGAKLKNAQVRMIPELLEKGFSQKAISVMYGVSYSTIKNVCQKRKWQYLDK